MPFRKGQSGNPLGRKKGVVTVRSKLLDGLKAAKIDETGFAHRVIQVALSGNNTALQLVADRLWPRVKPMMPELSLPGELATWRDRGEAIFELMASGHCTPDQAASAISVIDRVATLTELDELKQRIESLEEQKRY